MVMDQQERGRFWGIVCDGMGGHACGEVASETVAHAVCGGGKSLSEFLDSEVFVGMESTTLQPEKNGAEGFAGFMENYKRGLAAQYAASK